MALKSASAAPAATFEKMPTDKVGVETDKVVDQPAASDATPAAAPAAASVPAVAKSNLPAINLAKGALGDLQDRMTTDQVEAIGFGTFPRITADLGGLMMDDREIGKEGRFQIISWNLRHVVTPNSNDAEAKKLVRSSYDGKTISGSGESIADAIESMKAKGYEKASAKVYIDVWALMLSNEKDGELAEQKMVQLQLSPESVKQFKRYQLESGIKIAQGKCEATDTVTVGCERKEFNGNRYGCMTFA